MAVHPHDPGERLHQRIVARQIAPDRSCAERVERVIQDVGVRRAHRVLTDTDPLSDTRSHALEEDIGARRNRQRSLATCGGPKIEHNATLAGVHVAMHDAGPVHFGCPGTSIVAGGCLDLHDVGPELGKDHCGVGTRHVSREIDNPDTGKGGEGSAAKHWVGSAWIFHFRPLAFFNILM